MEEYVDLKKAIEECIESYGYKVTFYDEEYNLFKDLTFIEITIKSLNPDNCIAFKTRISKQKELK